MSPAEDSNPSRKPAWITGAAVLCIAAVMLTYARTFAFAWDEGYHLVAAWLIAHGKQPYIDFVFPQTPLNAYWNALLLRVFGENWRVSHRGVIAHVLHRGNDRRLGFPPHRGAAGVARRLRNRRRGLHRLQHRHHGFPCP